MALTIATLSERTRVQEFSLQEVGMLAAYRDACRYDQCERIEHQLGLNAAGSTGLRDFLTVVDLGNHGSEIRPSGLGKKVNVRSFGSHSSARVT
ncbi:hypothetical protein ABIE85_006197 [Bradyrhizobium diazoefficiens]|uniref:hypothetical protein n=1 Tax=Bradyrhizobium diazoefficiens TaxID=1355477 RepID=UPI0035191A4C